MAWRCKNCGSVVVADIEARAAMNVACTMSMILEDLTEDDLEIAAYDELQDYKETEDADIYLEDVTYRCDCGEFSSSLEEIASWEDEE